jgi:protein-L-isoaspartate(D-aspartate) O-methyltransferase
MAQMELEAPQDVVDATEAPRLTADSVLANFLVSLRSAGIRRSALLSAFEDIHRRAFLPPELKAHAYSPFALPIAGGEEATAPAMIARMLGAADPTGAERVLEIGCGSGFQTALISRLARHVVSLDRWLTLAEGAARAAQRHNLRNIEIRHADGLAFKGDEAFDLIIINAAIGEFPPALIAQLRPGGRIVAPLMTVEGQRLAVWQGETRLIDGPRLDFSSIRIGLSRAL